MFVTLIINLCNRFQHGVGLARNEKSSGIPFVWDTIFFGEISFFQVECIGIFPTINSPISWTPLKCSSCQDYFGLVVW